LLVGAALVVIAVVSVLSGPTMNRNVSTSALVLKDTQSANQAIALAQGAVTQAVVAASEHEAGLTSRGSVSAAVTEARARVSTFASASSRLPSAGDGATGAEYADSANMVIRHIDAGSAVTAEVFLTTRVQPIHDQLVVILEAKRTEAVLGILEAEASAERTAVMAQTLVLFAVVASGFLLLLLRWRNVPEGAGHIEAAVPYLRRVS
jgi:hypothetical protein